MSDATNTPDDNTPDAPAAETPAADATAVAEVSPMALEELGPGEVARGIPATRNLGRVLDVSVPVTARIGLIRKTVSDVIDLAPGTVLDLERDAGQPIDLMIGEKLIAHGEIVVVDGRYGVRITALAGEII